MTTKLNCEHCILGLHGRCTLPEMCLCAETEEHKKTVENLTVKKKSYSESGLNDALKVYLSQDYLKIAMIDTLWTVKNPVFIFDPTHATHLLDEFIENQTKYKKALKRAIREIFKGRHTFMSDQESIDFVNGLEIKFSESLSIKLSELGPKHTGIPLVMDCIILSLEERKLYTVQATARCNGNCNTSIVLETDPFSRRLQPPPKCDVEDCSMYGERMFVDPKTHVTEYIQRMTIQEPMEEAKHGSPITFECEIKGNDVYNAYIGQRKRIVAVFTAVADKKEATHEILLRAVSMMDGVDETPKVPTNQQIRKWVKMAEESETWMDYLLKSYAPEIYKDEQTELAVKSILMSLVKGTTVDRLRGDIHTLLVGDPSLGKTKLLEFLILVTQKSAYVNGRMASGPGLTIGMDQSHSGKRVPKAGPIALCHKGFVALDEMGRVKADDLTAIHQSMESGFITFTKSGYNFTLEAETTIIGAANPKSDTWDDDLKVLDNINLPKTILSRIDLIVNLRDIKDDINDQKIMQHILKMRRGEGSKEILTLDDFTKLLNYVRMISPKMTKESEKMIADFYYKIRKLDQKDGSLKADKRFSEAIYRVSTAMAKLHFSLEVTPNFVEMAIDLIKKGRHTLGMNVEEGQMIVDSETLVTTKETAVLKCARKLESVSKDNGHFPYDDLVDTVLDKEPEQFNNDKDAIIKFIDKQIDLGVYLRKGTDLRVASR